MLSTDSKHKAAAEHRFLTKMLATDKRLKCFDFEESIRKNLVCFCAFARPKWG